MFLEINEKNKNSIVVYSQNIFDPEENFRIIFNNGVEKRHKKINFSDVCDLLHYQAPKNLIVYRLLTNYEKIDAADAKFGCVIKVDNKDELIYFDPVFALKDLGNLVKNFNLQSFRFKIQQLGIRTLTYVNEKENFTEIFSYDLHAIEAQNQNDKIFADALYPENSEQNNKDAAILFEESISEIKNDSSVINDIKAINTLPVEREYSLSKPNTQNMPRKPSDRYEQKELLKRILGIEESNEKPDSAKENEKDEIPYPYTSSDLFKTTGKKNAAEDRKNDSIILKLTIS
jgi:hypothetical protein